MPEDYFADTTNCNINWCSSAAQYTTSNPSGFDCYAGFEEETCTCSDGAMPVMTGWKGSWEEEEGEEHTIYGYTCCKTGHDYEYVGRAKPASERAVRTPAGTPWDPSNTP